MNKTQLIELHPLAPDKPDYSARCNGCGVCCAVEPCPVAHLLLLQFKGKCRALLWQDEANRYMCGLVVYPDRYARLIPQSLRGSIGSFLPRASRSERGCDFAAKIDDMPGSTDSLP